MRHDPRHTSPEEICWSGSGLLLRFRGTFHFCEKEMYGRGGGEISGFAGIFAEYAGVERSDNRLSNGYPQKSHNLHLHAQVSHF